MQTQQTQQAEIERLAAGLVRHGLPLWAALQRAKEIYRKRQRRASRAAVLRGK